MQTLRTGLQTPSGRESVPSAISLLNAERSIFSDHVESDTLARECLDGSKTMIENYFKARDAADPGRFYDIHYKSLVKDSVMTVRRLYEHFGYEFVPDFEKRMLEWLAENQQHKHGKHCYSLEQFGLDRDMIAAALELYYRRFNP
ncbi:MAG: sulfotransferase [Gammaproteobacteria bacterium]|nr:sulfotransferase [Gammaproteobacteria bacterium]